MTHQTTISATCHPLCLMIFFFYFFSLVVEVSISSCFKYVYSLLPFCYDFVNTFFSCDYLLIGVVTIIFFGCRTRFSIRVSIVYCFYFIFGSTGGFICFLLFCIKVKSNIKLSSKSEQNTYDRIK
jgi:hypothetical protein